MRPASATRWIPGESCESAHSSPNSRALIHRSRSTASRRIRSKVLVPPPTDWVPTATHERASLPGMPVNLGVMAEVGRQETPTFTWNPVEQMWVQEKGGAAKPPSAPVFTTPRPATARPATATPKPATPAPTPPPDFVTPQVGAVGAIFHITFTGLPAAAPYRTSYTRGSVVTGYTTGEVPSNGVAVFDLRTSAGSFPPDTYFFTIRAGNAVTTVTFRVTG